MNDSPRRYANCYTKLIMTGDKPHIAVFAAKDLPACVELRYDYGGGDLPWRNVSALVISLVFYNVLIIYSVGRK